MELPAPTHVTNATEIYQMVGSQVEQYRKDKVITGELSRMASMHEVLKDFPDSRFRRYPRAFHNVLDEVIQSNKHIHQAIKQFEKDVWFNGLQDKVLQSKCRGFRMNFSVGIAMVYSLAGRTQITIEKEDHTQISLITADDEADPVMGQNSICATETEALELITKSRLAFLSGTRFNRDDKIGLDI